MSRLLALLVRDAHCFLRDGHAADGENTTPAVGMQVCGQFVWRTNRWGRGAFSRREFESLEKRDAKKRPVPFARPTRGTGRIVAFRPSEKIGRVRAKMPPVPDRQKIWPHTPASPRLIDCH